MPRSNSTISLDNTTGSKSSLWTWISLFGFCLAVFALMYILFVEAPPPKRLVIATGGKEGEYYRFAQRYAKLLEKDGITLEVRPTAGSLENLDLLLDDQSDVSVAFVQSGTADPVRCEGLNSLASLYREPLWIFQRGDQPITRLSQMADLKIAVGKEGSGTRVIARELLTANGIEVNPSLWIPETGTVAVDLLIQGKIDAAFFVAGVEAVYVRQLLKAPGIRLVELSQLEAYERRFHHLSAVKIPAGLLDFRENIPAQESKLLAPAATLVARKSLHRALVPLLLGAVTKINGRGDLIGKPGEFPSVLYTDLPIDDDAALFLKNGPPFLQRFLPFWLATFVDRMKLMVIPLVMLLMPLVRAAPPLMRWRIRRKIYRWYSQLRAIDIKSFEGMSKADAEKSLQRLSLLDQQVAYVDIPLSYMEEYYNLRVHLNLVDRRIRGILAAE